MDGQQILDHYTWEPGVCFRHPADGETPTAHIATIRPHAGGLQDLRACRKCVLRIEADRAAAAERQGTSYTPGAVAPCEQGE